MYHGVAPMLGVLPTVSVIAQEAVAGSTDWATYGAQLGVGAALVAFAVWLQDRMAKERKAELKELRAEMAELRKKHDSDLVAERDRHDATRNALLAALTGRNPQ